MTITIKVREEGAEGAVPGYCAATELEGISISCSSAERGQSVNSLKQVVLRTLAEQEAPPMCVLFEVISA